MRFFARAFLTTGYWGRIALIALFALASGCNRDIENIYVGSQESSNQ